MLSLQEYIFFNVNDIIFSIKFMKPYTGLTRLRQKLQYFRYPTIEYRPNYNNYLGRHNYKRSGNNVIS